jgi:hypothetical protein
MKLIEKNRKTGVEKEVSFNDVIEEIRGRYKDPDIVKSMSVFHTKQFTYKWTK